MVQLDVNGDDDDNEVATAFDVDVGVLVKVV